MRLPILGNTLTRGRHCRQPVTLHDCDRRACRRTGCGRKEARQAAANDNDVAWPLRLTRPYAQPQLISPDVWERAAVKRARASAQLTTFHHAFA